MTICADWIEFPLDFHTILLFILQYKSIKLKIKIIYINKYIGQIILILKSVKENDVFTSAKNRIPKQNRNQNIKCVHHNDV